MAGRVHLVLLCCLGITFYQVFALPFVLLAEPAEDSSSSSNDDDDDDVNIDGDYILNLANESKSSLVTLVGTVFKNFERNLSKAASETRIEALLAQMCLQNKCEQWPEWPECPALKGEYDVISRSRNCGRNTSRCTYPGNEYTETESTLCIGVKDPDEEETTATTTTTSTTMTTTTTMRTTARPVIVTTQAPATQCPENYENIAGFCLQLVTSFQLSQSMAATLCSWDSGFLMNANTRKKQLALYTLMFTKGHLEPVWLDGIRFDADTPFEYMDGPEPEMNLWQSGEPPSDFGVAPGPICRVELGPTVRKWIAKPCESTNLPFVCEAY